MQSAARPDDMMDLGGLDDFFMRVAASEPTNTLEPAPSGRTRSRFFADVAPSEERAPALAAAATTTAAAPDKAQGMRLMSMLGSAPREPSAAPMRPEPASAPLAQPPQATVGMPPGLAPASRPAATAGAELKSLLMPRGNKGAVPQASSAPTPPGKAPLTVVNDAGQLLEMGDLSVFVDFVPPAIAPLFSLPRLGSRCYPVWLTSPPPSPTAAG
jgi:hypothetical protein